MPRHPIVSALVIALSLISLGAATAEAQSADKPATRLTLKGYDPVAYFVLGKPVRGEARFEAVFDGSRYRFSTQKHMNLFTANPDKYAPQFAGACTAGLAHGVKIEANPLLWRIVDGKLYVFSGTKIPGQIKAEPAPVIDQARKNWPALKGKPYR